jgi:DNA-directed RNA polymerase subunit K/omega
MGALEFAVLSSLRAAQLSRGCVPLVPTAALKIATTAQLEVAAGKVFRAERPEGIE